MNKSKIGVHEEMLTYGLKEGTKDVLLHIDDERVLKGKRCGCVCPNCKKPLVARRGKINQHHFAHAPECKPCGKGRMTALHIMAQNILKERKTILLPPYKKNYVNEEAQIKIFKDVKLEEFCKVEDTALRPDCNCISKNPEAPSLWVEIYCRHKVEEEKKEEIIKRNQYCVEVDFRDLLNEVYTVKDVIKRLESDSSHKEWICCPVWDDLERQEIIKAEDRSRELVRQKQESVQQAEAVRSKYNQSGKKIWERFYSHFILYPNGEATLSQLKEWFDEENINIEPAEDSLYEVVINARANFNTFHYCYVKAQNEIYHFRDCRTCKFRKYDGLDFQNRDLGIFCDFSRYFESRYLPPQFAITCERYELDITISNDDKVKMLRIK